MLLYVTWQMLTHKYIIHLYLLQNGNKQHLLLLLLLKKHDIAPLIEPSKDQKSPQTKIN